MSPPIAALLARRFGDVGELQSALFDAVAVPLRWIPEYKHEATIARDRDRLVEMQLARPAVVVKAVGDVGILLDLDQAQPGADRVNGACRNVEEIAWPDRVPFQQPFDAAVKSGLAHGRCVERFAKADTQGRAGFGIEDQPALFLAVTRQLIV